MTTYAIELDGISKDFSPRRGDSIRAVDEVTLNIAHGQVYGLLGHNGAGKTTLIKMMCGLVTPTHGSVHVRGFHIQKNRARALSCIGVVLEGTRNVYWRFTPLQNLRYFAGLNGLRGSDVELRSKRLLKELQLWDHRSRRVGLLSRGMQQKVAIACALIADPEVILLDEPTLGLDYESSATVKGWIKSMARDEGRTVVLTTHQLDLAQELCDQVGIMHRGRLVVDADLSELISNSADSTVELVVKDERDALDPISVEKLFSDWTIKVNNDRTLRIRGNFNLVGSLESSVDLARSAGLSVLSARYPKPTLEDVYVSLGKSAG